jgi:hypothetical protein
MVTSFNQTRDTSFKNLALPNGWVKLDLLLYIVHVGVKSLQLLQSRPIASVGLNRGRIINNQCRNYKKKF